MPQQRKDGTEHAPAEPANPQLAEERRGRNVSPLGTSVPEREVAAQRPEREAESAD